MNTTVKSILNGWKNSIEKYNKLDSWKIEEQVSFLGRYLRSNNDPTDIVRLVHFIRDSVIGPNLSIISLLAMINKVLDMAEVSKNLSVFSRKRVMVELNYRDKKNVSRERQSACLVSVYDLRVICF